MTSRRPDDPTIERKPSDNGLAPLPELPSRRDSRDLADHVRREATLAKQMAALRSAELLADFEQQISQIYEWDSDETWAEATRAAERAMAEANATIAARAAELGIPSAFQPRLQHGWYGRRQNETAERRAELRKVAVTRVAAMEKAAKVQIETASLQTQKALLSGVLSSEEARAHLAAMPTAEELMPVLDIAQVRKAIGRGGDA